MTASAIVRHVQRCLGMTWSVMPCGAREAARGLSVLLHREGDGVRYQPEEGLVGPTLPERIARATDAWGAERLAEIEAGYGWLRQRAVVVTDEEDGVRFNVPAREARAARSGQSAGGAARPVGAGSSRSSAGGGSSVRARNGAMNVAMRGVTRQAGEGDEAYLERRQLIRVQAGLDWDRRHAAEVQLGRAQLHLNQPIPGQREAGGPHSVNPEADARRAELHAVGSSVGSSVGSTGEVAASVASAGLLPGSEVGLLAASRGAAAAASVDNSMISAAAAASPPARAGVGEGSSEVDREVDGSAHVASSQPVSEAARRLSDRAAATWNWGAAARTEGPGVVEGFLRRGYTDAMILAAIEARRHRKVKSAGYLQPALAEMYPGVTNPLPAASEPGAAPAPLEALHPEVEQHPLWRSFARPRQREIGAVLEALADPNASERRRRLNACYTIRLPAFMDVAGARPEIWAAADREPPEVRATG